MLGIAESDLKGLNILNVRKPVMLPIFGRKESKAVTTTVKSNQFQASLKYDPSDIMNPKAIIFKVASLVNTIAKNISELSTNLFPQY